MSAITLSAQEYRLAFLSHSIIHPGVSVARSFTLSEKIKVKEKKKGEKEIGKSNLFLPQINYHNVLKTENSFSIGAEIIRQRHRMKPANWTFETGFGVHYVRSFNAGKTFTIENGEVRRVRFAGNNFIAPSLSYSIGRTFYKNESMPWFFYLKPQVFAVLPYNGSFVPSVNFQIGTKKVLNFKKHE